jgi:23S rRNA pseudouridine2605 synthase
MTDKRDYQNPAGTPEENSPEGERIAKVMARVGLCSRRDAERWIADGRVAVNGKTLDSPAFNVKESDRVSVDGRPIGPRERTRLFMFHKLRGTVTTDHDPEGRPTIFEDLPRDLPRVITIGRLDINTEGLLLLTNDGGLARMLELPATGWLRRYRVRAHGDVTQPQLDALAEGVTIEGVEYRGIEATLDRVQGANVWLTMGLREGKNREIKRVLEHLGLSVNRLIRLSFGPFQLGDLPEGAVEEVKTRVLQDQLGEKLAEEAGVDFDAPIFADERGPRRQEARRQETREEAPRGRTASNEIGAPQSPDRNYRDVAVAKRKHVSVLRSERDGSADEPRKVERSKTQDRRGRTVAVERVAPRETEAPNESRNARRFAQERSGEEPKRSGEEPRREWSGDEPRRERSESRGERPRNERGRSDRARSNDERRGERSGGERPPMRRRDGEAGSGFQRPEFQRAEGGFKTEGLSEKRPYGDRPSRPPFKRSEGGSDRPPRSEGRSERPYGDRPSRPPFKRSEGGGDRPPRSEGRSERPYGDRPSRPPFKRSEGGGDRPPRSEGRSERPYGDRPSRPPFKRSEGGGDRPPRSEGRSEGRPPRESRRGEARPTGGKPFRDSPGGGRSFGDKPAGGGGFGTGGKPGGRKGGRPAGGKSFGGGKSGGGGRSFGSGKPNAGRSGPGGRPAGSRSGGKPGGRPGGKPGGGRRGDS